MEGNGSDNGRINLMIRLIQNNMAGISVTRICVPFAFGGAAAPEAPTNLVATPNSATEIDLAWDAVSGATSYKVYYGTDGVTYGSSTTSATNSKTVTGLTAGILYYFYVTTIAGGESAASNVVITFIPVFTLQDEFLTDDAAPLGTPRNCEPTGALTVVETDGQLSISGDVLTIPAPATAGWGRNGYYGAAATRANGVMHSQRLSLTSNESFLCNQWRTGQDLGYAGEHFVNHSPYFAQPENFRLGYVAYAGVFSCMLRSLGSYYFFDYNLYFISRTGATATLYPALSNYNHALTQKFERVAALPAPFNTATGLNLYSNATPPDGQTCTGAADGLLYFTWTPVLDEVLNIRYRRVDDDNCMIARFNDTSNTIKIIRRMAGAETEIASVAYTFTPATVYPLSIRYKGDRHHILVDSAAANLPLENKICGYNFNETGIKIDGSSTVTGLSVYPSRLTGSALSIFAPAINPFAGGHKSPKTVAVADGGDIAAAIATMDKGDTLSLAVDGTYNLGAGTTGFVGVPSGWYDNHTKVLGNNATINGGALGINFTGEYVDFHDLNFREQTSYCMQTNVSRGILWDNCTFKSTASAGFADATHFDKCIDVIVRNCVVLPSTGIGSLDGFECYGECENILFEDCEASGVVHGFECWTGASPNWINRNIRWRRCYSHDNTVGFSCEGGAQSLQHYNIVAEDCTVLDNATADYSADANGLLQRDNSPGTIAEATGGQVIDI